jgi:hypothetical protein
VRRRALNGPPPAAINDAWKVERMARAIGEMDDYGFGGTDDVHGA